VEYFIDYSQQFSLSTKIHSFKHTPISLFIKIADSIKGFSEVFKSIMQRENEATLHELLVAASPCPRKIGKGIERSAESK
jgi:hypothetical protein